MASVMDLFKVMLIVQLFYAFSITTLTYAVPDAAQNYVTSFSDLASEINLKGTGEQVRDSLQSQTDIPAIELGALVFYSGNILIDLLLNFAFAIPEMIMLLINGILMLISLDSYIWAQVQLFAFVAFSVAYILGVISLLTGIRSGRSVV